MHLSSASVKNARFLRRPRSIAAAVYATNEPPARLLYASTVLEALITIREQGYPSMCLHMREWAVQQALKTKIFPCIFGYRGFLVIIIAYFIEFISFLTKKKVYFNGISWYNI